MHVCIKTSKSFFGRGSPSLSQVTSCCQCLPTMVTVVIIAETVLCSLLHCVIVVLQDHCYAFQINSAIICQESTQLKALLSGTFLHKVSVTMSESVQLKQTLPNSVCCVAIVRMKEANSSSSYFMGHLSLVLERLKFLYISVGNLFFYFLMCEKIYYISLSPSLSSGVLNSVR